MRREERGNTRNGSVNIRRSRKVRACQIIGRDDAHQEGSDAILAAQLPMYELS